MDTHIYVNHVPGLEEQMTREVRDLPSLETENFLSIFNWESKDSKVVDYNPHPRIKFEVAI